MTQTFNTNPVTSVSARWLSESLPTQSSVLYCWALILAYIEWYVTVVTFFVKCRSCYCDLHVLQHCLMMSKRFPPLTLLIWPLHFYLSSIRCFLGILLEALGFLMPYHSIEVAHLVGTTIAGIAPFALAHSLTVQIPCVFLHSLAW